MVEQNRLRRLARSGGLPARPGTAFAEALAKGDDFGQAPVYNVGLYFSARSRDWIGRDKPEPWFRSFLGAHKACFYEHLMAGVLFDENATLAALNRFPVVCLPNVGFLSEPEVSRLGQYVEQGGNLIVTGQSGRFDRWGKPRAGSSLERLIGATAVRSLDSLDNFLRFSANDGESLLRDLRADWPMLVYGPATVYRPTSAAAYGELLKPYRMTKHQSIWPMSANAPVGPAVLINHLGKGTVLTFAAAPDAATASSYPVGEVRKLFRNAVRLLHPWPRAKIEAPANVEAVVTDDPAHRTLRVHLIGYNAPPQVPKATDYPNIFPAAMEDAPMYRAAVEIGPPIKGASAYDSSTPLSTTGNRLEATIHNIHEVLRIKY